MDAPCFGRIRSRLLLVRHLFNIFRFKLHKQHLVEFAQVAIHKAYHHDSMINRVMPRDNIALMAVLEVLPGIYKRKPDVPSFAQVDRSASDDLQIGVPPEDLVVGSKIVLCAAHVYWDPEFCDVKLIQSMMLVHECARQIEQVADESGVGLQVCFYFFILKSCCLGRSAYYLW
jgi:CCR4-NOT transcription complex subunit 6